MKVSEINPTMRNILKGWETLKKIYSKGRKIFRVCLSISEPYTLLFWGRIFKFVPIMHNILKGWDTL